MSSSRTQSSQLPPDQRSRGDGAQARSAQWISRRWRPQLMTATERGLLRLSKPVQDVASGGHLDLLRRYTSGMEPVAQHPLVPREGVSNRPLLMVARLLLPSPATDLRAPANRLVPFSRPRLATRHGCRSRWMDSDSRSGASFIRCCDAAHLNPLVDSSHVTLADARFLTQLFRHDYNHHRPHSSLGM